jgi:hypothetical protein
MYTVAARGCDATSSEPYRINEVRHEYGLMMNGQGGGLGYVRFGPHIGAGGID